MANDEAWQAGMDIAQQRRDKKMWNTPAQQKPKKKGGILGKVMHVLSPISNFDKGGKVKKTGVYKLKRGERVLTAAQDKRCISKKRGRKHGAGRKRTLSKE